MKGRKKEKKKKKKEWEENELEFGKERGKHEKKTICALGIVAIVVTVVIIVVTVIMGKVAVTTERAS